MTQPEDPPNKRRAPPRGDRPRIGIAAPDTRPEIILTPDVHLVTRSMIEALRADADLYSRSGMLAHVVRQEEEVPGIARDTPTIRACPLSWLIDRVSAHARVLRKGKEGDWVHVPPPSARVTAVLDRGSWPGIRELDLVIETPTMRTDGTIVQSPGYDPSTRSLYLPSVDYPTVPESPSHSDAVIAYTHLADIFHDFPYVADTHKSATISAIMTIIARPAIRGAVPCWMFDASSKRSGKSLQMDLVSTIASGRPASRMTFPSGHDGRGDDRELESVLSSYALSGLSIVPFDNVSQGTLFGGAPLDKCITSEGEVDLRILGRTELRRLRWIAVILASGNNVSFRDDMLPRVLCPRLESPLDNPELRGDFRHGDADAIRAYALAHRASLVADALTILRAYVVAGRPPQPVPKWGGFDGWRALIASALVWVGAPDPTGARRGLAGDDDPLRAAECALVHGWGQLCEKYSVAGLKASEGLSYLFPPPGPDDPPDEWGDLRESIEVLTRTKHGYAPGPKALGDALRRLKAAPRDGKRLLGEVETSGKTTRWRVARSGS